MKRLLEHKSLIAGIVFLVLVIVSGAALSASGNWENPLAAFTTQGEQRGGPGEGFAPPQDAQGANSPAGRPDASEGGRDESASISWSQLGQVLYNVWFLFAAAAVVMVVQVPLRAIRKGLRQRMYVMKAPSPISA